MNKRYSDTLEFITPLYRDNYEDRFGIPEIIDALYGVGKSESDFNWIIQPKIIKLNSDTLKMCIEFLKPKRKFCPIYDLYCNIIMQGDYYNFSEEQLGEFLVKNTAIFDIKIDRNFFWDVEVKLKRQ